MWQQPRDVATAYGCDQGGIWTLTAAERREISTMTAPTLTLAQLKKLQPRKDALERIAPFMGDKEMTAHEARAAGATFDNLVWVASTLARRDSDVERRVRLWLLDCAAHVLYLYERDFPANDRPRDAIIASRAFIHGKVNDAVSTAASAAVWAVTKAGNAAGNAAASAAAWATSDAACAAGDAAWVARAASAVGAASDAAGAAAGAAERDWQFDRLILWLSDKEPEDFPLPR